METLWLRTTVENLGHNQRSHCPLHARSIARYGSVMDTREAIRAELLLYERRMLTRIGGILAAMVVIVLAVLPALLK